MNKRLVVLLGVLAVSVGSAQADWIKHEGHGATAKGASGVTRINFNQVKHSDLDGFVTACKTSCDENSDTCGGFILNYANTDKTRPAVCLFKGEDFSLVEKPTKDFYQVVTHDEVLALLEQLVPNLNVEEMQERLDALERGEGGSGVFEGGLDCGKTNSLVCCTFMQEVRAAARKVFPSGRGVWEFSDYVVLYSPLAPLCGVTE
jgi:hypothetical protein